MTIQQRNILFDILQRLQGVDDTGACWETCIEIARELGADALNIAKFKGQAMAPLWIRISSHERGGLEEYVMNDYISVDPVLLPPAMNTMKDVNHISLHRNLSGGRLSEKEIACHQHLLKYGQSDYIAVRVRDADKEEETVIVFLCTPDTAQKLIDDGLEQLSVIANLFALHITPPTPQQPVGKVPLLYDFLSNRERDVLTLLAQGMQNEKIGHILGISEATVRLHTTNAKKKMNATTRAQAIALAMSRGLINP